MANTLGILEVTLADISDGKNSVNIIDSTGVIADAPRKNHDEVVTVRVTDHIDDDGGTSDYSEGMALFTSRRYGAPWEQINKTLSRPSHVSLGDAVEVASNSATTVFPKYDATVFDPNSILLADDVSMIYDFKDRSTTFQDATLTVPATSNGQIVGGIQSLSTVGQTVKAVSSAPYATLTTEGIELPTGSATLAANWKVLSPRIGHTIVLGYTNTQTTPSSSMYYMKQSIPVTNDLRKEAHGTQKFTNKNYTNAETIAVDGLSHSIEQNVDGVWDEGVLRANVTSSGSTYLADYSALQVVVGQAGYVLSRVAIVDRDLSTTDRNLWAAWARGEI